MAFYLLMGEKSSSIYEVIDSVSANNMSRAITEFQRKWSSMAKPRYKRIVVANASKFRMVEVFHP